MKKLLLILAIIFSSTILFAQGRGHKYGHWKHRDHGRYGYYVDRGYYPRYYGRPYYVRHRYYDYPRYHRRYDARRGVYVTVRL